MKKFKIILAILTMIVATNAIGQTWDLAGNNGIVPGTDILGTTDATPIPFYTNGDERMRLTVGGFLGLNTPTPLMRFHVEDGGILSTGVQGTNTVTGAGTRLMWIPDSAAFRAGRIGISGGTDSYWNAANVGLGSAAFGTDNRAAGEDSFAQGQLNNVTGECSMAFGGSNEITHNLGFAIGRENDILNTDAITFGFRNEINESGSVLMGTDLRSNAEGSITIGRGAGGNDRLTNTEDNSIMLGTLSDVPTVFVSPANGVGTFGNVGIGNITAPTEVLDVNGTARLRVVQSGTPNVLITGVEADANGDYVLNHLALNGSGNQFLADDGTWQTGTNVCDWDITSQNLTMGFSGACHTGYVGIGRATPARKLDVLVGTEPTNIGGNNDVAAGRFINTNIYTRPAGVMGVAIQETPSTEVGANTGGYFAGANAGGTAGSNYGVVAVANDLLPQQGEWVPSAKESIAVRALASSGHDVFGVYATATYGSARNFGVSGYAHLPINGAYNVGVAGRADCTPNFMPVMNIGVYGEAQNGCGLPSNRNYAGYFAGSVMIGGSAFYFSDVSLKTNVQGIDDALNSINQLNPKTYDYLTEENSSMGLPEGQQYGLIAQEVAEVLPNLTQLVSTLPELDSIGNVLTEQNEYLAINYTGLIPILIAGMQEQQTIIESQNEALAQMMEQLAAMQQQINQCCNANDGSKSMPGGTFQPQDLNNGKSSEGSNELYQNIPNPFRESTTISYLLEKGGRVQLNIYDKTGKVITTLTDANQGPGRYSAVWNANGMPSGVYHYALYVNGELLVKRAIKLQE